MNGRERWVWVTIVLAQGGVALWREARRQPHDLPVTAAGLPPGCSSLQPTGRVSPPEPWTMLSPPVDLPPAPWVWDVFSHPDQLVDKPITLVGYLVMGRDFALLAQTQEEVHIFDAWRAARPRDHPRVKLLGLRWGDDGPKVLDAADHGRKVLVRGRVAAPRHAQEPDPVLRWASGVSFHVEALERVY